MCVKTNKTWKNRRSLDKMLLKLQVNFLNVQNTQCSKFFHFSKSSKFLKCSKLQSCQNHNSEKLQNDASISILSLKKFKTCPKPLWCNLINKSIYVRNDVILQHLLTFFDCFMMMPGRKWKCKDDIKSYSLDRFEQVKWSKTILQAAESLKNFISRPK